MGRRSEPREAARRKLIAFDGETWQALHQLSLDSMKSVQELADEAIQPRQADAGEGEEHEEERELGHDFTEARQLVDVARVETLPSHHRDPFDRLIAAQALNDDLAIVTRDAVFRRYGLRRVW